MKFVDFNARASLSGWAVALTLALSAGSAYAAQPTAASILKTFNLVTTGNVSTQEDIEGSAVIGGNLNGASFFNNDVPANPEILLYGSLGNNENLDNGGNIYYAGSTAGKVNFNGGGKNLGAPANPAAYYTAPLSKLSTQLGALAATAGTSISNGNFNAGSNSGIVVFDVTAGQLASDLQNSQVTFSGSGVTSFIVNVTGNYSEGGGINFNTPQRDALFNFVNATSVDLGNWKTSVLAPDASLGVLNGYIAGSVYAASFTGGGELHNDNLFDGALPAVAAVPEVSTWAMMLVGAGLIGAAARRRRVLAIA